jgi:integrase
MPKHATGLTKKGEIWHIDKRIKGFGRLSESTGARTVEAAEEYLGRRIEEIRNALVYGIRPKRLFRAAATKFLLENQHKRSILTDAYHLEQLDEWIGDLTLDKIHDATLKPFVDYRLNDGKKHKTINLALEVVRRILNLAARSWRDEFGITWLETAPLITMLKLTDSRAPYPLDWDEQTLLLEHMPAHLQRMGLYKVNVGSREDEVCLLQWDWEIKIPELQTSVFLIPGAAVKNTEDRLIVLNRVAMSIINQCRGDHHKFVFTWKRGKGSLPIPIASMNNTAWVKGREAAADAYEDKFGYPSPAGFRNLRVHDLKHTFGRRLRAAGVSNETRKVLLGHKNGDITSHYSAPEIQELLDAANLICETDSRKTPELTIIKRKIA